MPNAVVAKLWNYCNLLRDDGLSYGDYLEQLTYLLFLKMGDEQTRPPFSRESIVPVGLDWASLARLDGTLVLLMGVSTLGAASAALIQHGKPASTPAAVIESGFTDRQRTTTGTLATIADLAQAVEPPAVIVIGDVVDLHAALGSR